jgi:RecA/RadA recombinase
MDIFDVKLKRAFITGHSKPVLRMRTGLWSFDRAFRHAKDTSLGFPLGKITELWGSTHTGKSTVVYSLTARIAAYLSGKVVLADLEDFDPELVADIYTSNGFSGEIHSVSEDTDEKVLAKLLDVLADDEFCVGILDAVGTIAPYGEKEGKFGEANMGQRAKLMAQFSRKAIDILRKGDDYKSLFLVNHQHMPMGGFGKGYKPPGGDTKGYLASIRIPIKRLYITKQGDRLYGPNGVQLFPEGSYCIHGQVDKNKWGWQGGEFYLFVLSGKGIHTGLTALLDGFMFGHVKRSRAIIKIGNESFGTMQEIIQKAQNGDDEFFQPFFDVLSTNDEIVVISENGDDEDE